MCQGTLREALWHTVNIVSIPTNNNKGKWSVSNVLVRCMPTHYLINQGIEGFDILKKIPPFCIPYPI